MTVSGPPRAENDAVPCNQRVHTLACRRHPLIRNTILLYQTPYSFTRGEGLNTRHQGGFSTRHHTPLPGGCFNTRQHTPCPGIPAFGQTDAVVSASLRPPCTQGDAIVLNYSFSRFSVCTIDFQHPNISLGMLWMLFS